MEAKLRQDRYGAALARGEQVLRPRSVHIPTTGATKLWPNATMYYTMQPDVQVQQNLNSAIDYWNKVGPFKILPRTSEPNYITFRSSTADLACASALGMVGGQQIIEVTTNCPVGSAIHELGHAWGLLHEQERSDYGAYVNILFENIDKRFWYNFTPTSGSVSSGYYDYESIMHYPPTGFSANFLDALATVPLGIPIGQRERYPPETLMV